MTLSVTAVALISTGLDVNRHREDEGKHRHKIDLSDDTKGEEYKYKIIFIETLPHSKSFVRAATLE